MQLQTGFSSSGLSYFHTASEISQLVTSIIKAILQPLQQPEIKTIQVTIFFTRSYAMYYNKHISHLSSFQSQVKGILESLKLFLQKAIKTVSKLIKQVQPKKYTKGRTTRL